MSRNDSQTVVHQLLTSQSFIQVTGILSLFGTGALWLHHIMVTGFQPMESAFRALDLGVSQAQSSPYRSQSLCIPLGWGKQCWRLHSLFQSWNWSHNFLGAHPRLGSLPICKIAGKSIQTFLHHRPPLVPQTISYVFYLLLPRTQECYLLLYTHPTPHSSPQALTKALGDFLLSPCHPVPDQRPWIEMNSPELHWLCSLQKGSWKRAAGGRNLIG